MTLTLVEVRNRLLSKTKYAHLPETNQWNKEMADAIDAYLAAQPASPEQPAGRQGEAVGIVEGIDDETNTVTVEWRGPISCGDALFVRNEFDFAKHLQRQRDWSGKTFGPGSRAQGVVDHICKELLEIEADPGDLKEWIDVVILALDGAWRSGAQPQEIISALVEKQTKNEGRVWPDWRTADPTKAIEHDRTRDTHPAAPVGVPDGWVLVPIELPMLRVPEIKDALSEEFGIHDCKARPLWAELLKIVAGVGIDDLLAAAPSPEVKS